MTVKRRSESSASISSRDDDLLFTTDRSNMDYVTLSGVCKQIVAKEPDKAVYILGQALDSTESYASATSVPVILLKKNLSRGLKDLKRCLKEREARLIISRAPSSL